MRTREMEKKLPDVNHEAISLSRGNTLIHPPPLLEGAIEIRAIDRKTQGIANFIQALKTDSGRNIKIRKSKNETIENKNNGAVNHS